MASAISTQIFWNGSGDDQKEPSDHHAFSTEPVRVIPVIGIIQRPRNAEANGVIRLYRRQEVA